MAETLYAPSAKALTASAQVLFTATAKCIVEVIVTNSTNAPVAALISWTDASASGASALLIPNTPVPATDAIVSFRKTLEVGDALTGLAASAGALVASVNVLLSES
jgi:hypothetical protein